MSPRSAISRNRKLKIMAANAKRESPERERPELPEHPENSELEVLKAQIRKLEATVIAKTEELLAKDEELLAKDEELQMIKNDENDDILSVVMNNTGFKHIADKILSLLDCKSFVQCSVVCRSWKNFIDNEWSMLQMQIFHLKEVQYQINLEPVIKIMKKNPNKSELRVFIKICQELVSKRCNFKLACHPVEYMIDHHRHQELTILLHPFKDAEIYTHIFKYACQYGCEICVKLLLDMSEEKEIDLNLIKKWDRSYKEPHEYEHCLIVASKNICFKKDVLDLLLRSAEEKGIDMNAKTSRYGDNTLRDKIIFDLKYSWSGIGDYTEATYKILKIDPSVHLKKTQ